MDRNPIERIFCEKIYVATNSLFPRGEGQVVLRGQLWEVDVRRGNITTVSKCNFPLSPFFTEKSGGAEVSTVDVEVLREIITKVAKCNFLVLPR